MEVEGEEIKGKYWTKKRRQYENLSANKNNSHISHRSQLDISRNTSMRGNTSVKGDSPGQMKNPLLQKLARVEKPDNTHYGMELKPSQPYVSPAKKPIFNRTKDELLEDEESHIQSAIQNSLLPQLKRMTIFVQVNNDVTKIIRVTTEDFIEEQLIE